MTIPRIRRIRDAAIRAESDRDFTMGIAAFNCGIAKAANPASPVMEIM